MLLLEGQLEGKECNGAPGFEPSCFGLDPSGKITTHCSICIESVRSGFDGFTCGDVEKTVIQRCYGRSGEQMMHSFSEIFTTFNTDMTQNIITGLVFSYSVFFSLKFVQSKQFHSRVMTALCYQKPLDQPKGLQNNGVKGGLADHIAVSVMPQNQKKSSDEIEQKQDGDNDDK